MGARVLIAERAGASAKRSEDFVSALVADGTVTDSAARVATALALSARSGVVENQTKGELAQLCGMPIRRFDRACDELIERGILRRSQSRPYAPNRYEIVSLTSASGSSFLHDSDLTSSDSWGSGAVGSPQPPSIEGAGAPATLLPSNRRSESANDEPQEDANPTADPLWKLTSPILVPVSVWSLARRPTADVDPNAAYLGWRYLIRVKRVPLPEKTAQSWPQLLHFLKSGGLKRPGVYEALEASIVGNPLKARTTSGDLISLREEELIVCRRYYKANKEKE